MTQGPTPTQPPKNEAEYARKLALAILSTLESKGLLTRLDVDTILHAAHRAAQLPNSPVAGTLAPGQPALGQPTLGQPSLSQHDTFTPAPAPSAAEASAPSPGLSPSPSGRISAQPGIATPGNVPVASSEPPPSLTGSRSSSGPIGPAVLGTHWVKPGVAALPGPVPPATPPFTESPIEAIASNAESPAPTGIKLLPPVPSGPQETPASREAPAKPAAPLVIDFKLD